MSLASLAIRGPRRRDARSIRALRRSARAGTFSGDSDSSSGGLTRTPAGPFGPILRPRPRIRGRTGSLTVLAR